MKLVFRRSRLLLLSIWLCGVMTTTAKLMQLSTAARKTENSLTEDSDKLPMAEVPRGSMEEASHTNVRKLKSKSMGKSMAIFYNKGYWKGKGYFVKGKGYWKGKGYKGYKGKGVVGKGFKGKGKGYYYKGKGKGYWKGKGYKGYKGYKGKGKGYWKGKGYNTDVTRPPSVTPPPLPSPPPVPVTTTPPTPDCSTCRTGCLSVTDFVLVDADQDLNAGNPPSDYLLSLQEGQTYSLSALRTQFGVTNFALLCVTDPLPFATTPFQIGSVGIRDNNYRTHEGQSGNNSGKDYNSEGSPPYVLADDDNGDYNPTDFTLGEAWSVTCQAFCEADLLGDESAPVTRTFTMTA